MPKDPDPKFLNRYFRSVYNKLEADALLFNRKLPHEGLKGSENEQALADILRDFLPPRYGIEVNALLIDRNGKSSRQCDIVIYDNQQFPKYFRKVFPIELVFAVVEVKTELTKQRVDEALMNESAMRELEYVPLFSPYWITRTEKEQIEHAPPIHCIFGYRSNTEDFSTYASWFAGLPTSTPRKNPMPYASAFNHFVACCLDKGIIFCRGDGYMPRWLTIAEEKNDERNFPALAEGKIVQVDPAKALLFFMETLWTMLEQSPRHPGFDIRSYMDVDLGSFIEFSHDGRIKRPH